MSDCFQIFPLPDMKFSATLLGLATVSLVSAYPGNRLVSRAVTMDNAGFSGACTTYHVTDGQCVDLSGHQHANGASSFGPSPGPISCTIFVDPDCTGVKSFGPIRSPGYSDLSVIDFNDQMSSFLCIFDK
ncbi:hypothetical protein B0H19DRAFT_1274000 [Mycena capillaripes]|nr:hypothetical protein B0H19DRAFT_1274000 [Mycena capillaripes]